MIYQLFDVETVQLILQVILHVLIVQIKHLFPNRKDKFGYPWDYASARTLNCMESQNILTL